MDESPGSAFAGRFRFPAGSSPKGTPIGVLPTGVFEAIFFGGAGKGACPCLALVAFSTAVAFRSRAKTCRHRNQRDQLSRAPGTCVSFHCLAVLIARPWPGVL